jgi:hypothetical protein
MIVTSMQYVDCDCYRLVCWQKRICAMARIIQAGRSGLLRVFAGLAPRYPYRWYEVEVACF